MLSPYAMKYGEKLYYDIIRKNKKKIQQQKKNESLIANISNATDNFISGVLDGIRDKAIAHDIPLLKERARLVIPYLKYKGKMAIKNYYESINKYTLSKINIKQLYKKKSERGKPKAVNFTKKLSRYKNKKGILGFISDKFEDGFEEIEDGFKEIGDWIKEIKEKKIEKGAEGWFNKAIKSIQGKRTLRIPKIPKGDIIYKNIMKKLGKFIPKVKSFLKNNYLGLIFGAYDVINAKSGEKMRTASGQIGALFGGIIGDALGVAFAPETGGASFALSVLMGQIGEKVGTDTYDLADAIKHKKTINKDSVYHPKNLMRGLNIASTISPQWAPIISVVKSAGYLFKNRKKIYDKAKDITKNIKSFKPSYVPLLYRNNSIFASLNNLFKPHSAGLSYVPYDGYLAELHKGERVMTASENRSYSNPARNHGKNSSRGGNVFNITINGINKTTDEIINELVYKMSEAINTMGEVAV